MVHGRGEATTLTAYAGDMAEVRLIEAGRDRILVHQQELLHALWVGVGLIHKVSRRCSPMALSIVDASSCRQNLSATDAQC